MMEKMLSWALFLLLSDLCQAELPKKPENISCIFYYKKNFTCTWSPEKEIHPTIYTVHRIYQRGHTRDNCISENQTSCSFFFPYLPYPNEYSIKVEAKNNFGEQMSEETYWNLKDIVKIAPPRILTVGSVPGVSDMLYIEWRKPEGVPISSSYTCCLRYRIMNSSTWEQVNQRMEDERPYTLTGLLPLQQYGVSMQCQVNSSKLWSSWSEEKIGTTVGLAPNSSLDLWRVIGPVQPDGRRTVQLFWKVAKAEPHRGQTLGYSIYYFPENETSFNYTMTTVDRQFELKLGRDSYLVSVVYYTSDGVSPEAILRIPADNESSLQCIEAVQAHLFQDYLMMEWQTSNAAVDRWVIEWYEDLETENLNRSWEFVSQTRNWTIREDNFMPFQCYNISVYPVVGIDIGIPYSIQVYSKEGVPLIGPLATAQDINATTATIKWKEIPKMQRRGFISNYTVFYKPFLGKEIAKTVNSSILQCELEFLESSTQYTVKVMASTVAGGKNGTSFDFKTLSISQMEFVLLSSLLGGGFLFLFILVMVCVVTKSKLKRLICPEIPNPAKSNVVLWHGDDVKSKLHLREVQFHGGKKVIDEIITKPSVSSSGDLIDKLVVEFENFLDKTEVHKVELMKTQENVLSGEENEYVNSPYSLYSPSGKVFQGLSSSGLTSLEETQEQSSEKPGEEAKDRPCQNSTSSAVLEPGQQTWGETELNPYLKNSVTTREFLTSEKLSDSVKKTEIHP